MAGLGIATLTTMSVTGPWVSPSHESLYHLNGPAGPVFLAVSLDLCIVWAVAAVVLWLAPRWAAGFRWVWCLLLAFLPMVIVRNWASLTGTAVPRWVLAATIVVSVVVMLPLALNLNFNLKRGRDGSEVHAFHAVQEFAATILGFSAVLGVLILAQLAWFGWRARDVNTAIPLHHPVARNEAMPQHLVIWILLDELSYEQVYEHRLPGLRLPEFDRLAGESTVFTHTVPAGENTAEVIPSLMTGLRVDRLRTSDEGKLEAVHDADSGSWKPFDPHQTIFADALDKGYETAVAGWYNPYCRILAPVLDRCYWTSRLPYHGHIYANRPVWTNVAGPVLGFAASGWRDLRRQGGATGLDQERARMHLEDYTDLLEAGDADLSDPSAGFVLLHLPIPHPGGIFDFKRGVYSTTGRSYVDNLALADKYLTHVREVLERRGAWDSATVVVMGDHSWRTKLIWKGSPDWTAQDQVASHGGEFDDRPAYMVKLPGQRVGAMIDAPYRAIRTRALLDALLANRVRDEKELRVWVQAGSQ